MLSLINILDWSGFLLGCTGVILVGQIRKFGYVLLLITNICYGVLGLLQGNYGLLSVSADMGAIDIYYWIKWRNNEINKRGGI